jgi:hypothetical protein
MPQRAGCRPPTWGCLPAQAELGDQGAVTFHVLFLQVLEQAAPPSYHLQEAPPRMKIVLVGAQVLRKVPDALRKDRYLDLRRTSVTLVQLVVLDDPLFVLYCRQLFSVSSLFSLN